MLDYIVALFIAVGIPYALVLGLLVLWNLETPPETVEHNRD